MSNILTASPSKTQCAPTDTHKHHRPEALTCTHANPPAHPPTKTHPGSPTAASNGPTRDRQAWLPDCGGPQPRQPAPTLPTRIGNKAESPLRSPLRPKPTPGYAKAGRPLRNAPATRSFNPHRALGRAGRPEWTGVYEGRMAVRLGAWLGWRLFYFGGSALRRVTVPWLRATWHYCAMPACYLANFVLLT